MRAIQNAPKNRFASLVVEQRKVIQARFDWVLRNWGPDSRTPDLQMVLAGIQDRKDLLDLVDLLEEGELKRAGEMARYMDSAIRELIIPEIYSAISEECS